MSKERNRGNREAKKPKAEKKPAAPAGLGPRHETTIKGATVREAAAEDRRKSNFPKGT